STLRGDDQADPHRPQPPQPGELAADVLERRDAVAQSRRVLEAQLAGDPAELGPQLRQRVVDRLPFDALQGAGGELGAPAPLERAERTRLRAADARVAATAQIDVAIGAHRARVRRRPQLADQPELLERRLELRPGDTPLDARERAERRLDRGALAVGA